MGRALCLALLVAVAEAAVRYPRGYSFEGGLQYADNNINKKENRKYSDEESHSSFSNYAVNVNDIKSDDGDDYLIKTILGYLPKGVDHDDTLERTSSNDSVKKLSEDSKIENNVGNVIKSIHSSDYISGVKKNADVYVSNTQSNITPIGSNCDTVIESTSNSEGNQKVETNDKLDGITKNDSSSRLGYESEIKSSSSNNHDAAIESSYSRNVEVTSHATTSSDSYSLIDALISDANSGVNHDNIKSNHSNNTERSEVKTNKNNVVIFNNQTSYSTVANDHSGVVGSISSSDAINRGDLKSNNNDKVKTLPGDFPKNAEHSSIDETSGNIFLIQTPGNYPPLPLINKTIVNDNLRPGDIRFGDMNEKNKSILSGDDNVRSSSSYNIKTGSNGLGDMTKVELDLSSSSLNDQQNSYHKNQTANYNAFSSATASITQPTNVNGDNISAIFNSTGSDSNYLYNKGNKIGAIDINSPYPAIISPVNLNTPAKPSNIVTGIITANNSYEGYISDIKFTPKLKEISKPKDDISESHNIKHEYTLKFSEESDDSKKDIVSKLIDAVAKGINVEHKYSNFDSITHYINSHDHPTESSNDKENWKNSQDSYLQSGNKDENYNHSHHIPHDDCGNSSEESGESKEVSVDGYQHQDDSSKETSEESVESKEAFKYDSQHTHEDDHDESGESWEDSAESKETSIHKHHHSHKGDHSNSKDSSQSKHVYHHSNENKHSVPKDRSEGVNKNREQIETKHKEEIISDFTTKSDVKRLRIRRSILSNNVSKEHRHSREKSSEESSESKESSKHGNQSNEDSDSDKSSEEKSDRKKKGNNKNDIMKSMKSKKRRPEVVHRNKGYHYNSRESDDSSNESGERE